MNRIEPRACREDIDVTGHALESMKIPRHAADDCIRDVLFLQAIRQPVHRLVHVATLREEFADQLEAFVNGLPDHHAPHDYLGAS
ncbi:MAG TPA: hypothetical protein VJ276_22260 [Thermoanaerobaculia bacterium]|nr:hypothetical protein [Thermoanaerobaculia bacterium]